jgi:hypothetical protein
VDAQDAGKALQGAAPPHDEGTAREQITTYGQPLPTT